MSKTITKIAVMSTKELTAIAGAIVAAERELEVHVLSRSVAYKQQALNLIADIPSGLGADASAYAEYSRRLNIVSEKAARGAVDEIKRAKIVRDYLHTLAKSTGWNAPSKPVDPDEAKRKDAAARKAKSRATAQARTEDPAADSEALAIRAKDILAELTEDAKQNKKQLAMLVKQNTALGVMAASMELCFEDCMDADLQSSVMTEVKKLNAIATALAELARSVTA